MIFLNPSDILARIQEVLHFVTKYRPTFLFMGPYHLITLCKYLKSQEFSKAKEDLDTDSVRVVGSLGMSFPSEIESTIRNEFEGKALNSS